MYREGVYNSNYKTNGNGDPYQMNYHPPNSTNDVSSQKSTPPEVSAVTKYYGDSGRC